MSLRLIENFDSIVTADLTDRGWTLGNGTILAGAGRNGTASLRVTATTLASKILDAQSSWVCGFSFRYTQLPTAISSIFRWTDAGTTQCSLTLNIDGTLSVRLGTVTALTGGNSTLALVAGTVYYIEWKVTIADSIAANSCKVRVNGTDWLTVAAGQDVKSTANASANGFSMGMTQTLLNCDFDDFYICDGTGTTNKDFLGDVKGVTARPTGNGISNQFTPSAGTHWENVDDAAPNDDTDYNESTTVGHIDLFSVAPLSVTPLVINGVRVAVNLKKTDAGVANARVLLRSGGTTYAGPIVALGTTYTYMENIWESDPATSLPWTRAGRDAIQAGYEYVS